MHHSIATQAHKAGHNLCSTTMGSEGQWKCYSVGGNRGWLVVRQTSWTPGSSNLLVEKWLGIKEIQFLILDPDSLSREKFTTNQMFEKRLYRAWLRIWSPFMTTWSTSKGSTRASPMTRICPQITSRANVSAESIPKPSSVRLELCGQSVRHLHLFS